MRQPSPCPPGAVPCTNRPSRRLIAHISNSDHYMRVSEERVASGSQARSAPMTATSQLGATSTDSVKVGNSDGQILMLSPTES